jgi:hypothetical protein
MAGLNDDVVESCEQYKYRNDVLYGSGPPIFLNLDWVPLPSFWCRNVWLGEFRDP